MNNSRIIIWIAAGLVVAGIAFMVARPAGGVRQDIDNGELRELMNEGARLIDVRTSGEFAAGTIQGAENVPVDTIESVATSWDKTQPVIVFCAVGSRSTAAANWLSSNGFEKVYNLKAGIAAWDGDVASPDVAAGGDPGTTPDPQGAPTTPAEPIATGGTPVMYEFFTDW